ncbi:MAG: hypothetical protein E7635_07715 [Ruminococcaceae bacterium]|nr:hypothetical protein [Oscillospiraceae bacterium]
MQDNLIYDKPRSKGEENAIKRAHQLLNTKWTPIWECKFNEEKYVYPAKSGRKFSEAEGYTGLPYSSTRVLDKIVGLDISFDTFISAVDNPASILYKRNLADFNDDAFNPTINNVFFAYGVVCSSLVSYVLDLPLHRCTHELDISPEFDEITDKCSNSLELCDVIVTSRSDGRTGGHVRIITGLGRDNEGNVKSVEYTEGVQPFSRKRIKTDEEFNKTFIGSGDKEGKYRIFRYKYIDGIREPMPYKTEQNHDLILNLGNGTNYIFGEDVEINIMGEADTLVVESDNASVSIEVADIKLTSLWGENYRIYKTSSLAPGFYRAYLVKKGKKSDPIEFAVVKLPDVTFTHSDGTPFERIALIPVTPEGEPLTKESKCLYTEDGALKVGKPVTIALKNGDRLAKARIGFCEINGELVAKTAAVFTDASGKRIMSFKIGDDVTLYALKAKENEIVKTVFKNHACTFPYSICWKEEAQISYFQRLITNEEIACGKLESTVESHFNAFSHFQITCKNDYGKVNTDPIAFIVEE